MYFKKINGNVQSLFLLRRKIYKNLEEWRIELQTFRMQSEHSTTELHPHVNIR